MLVKANYLQRNGSHEYIVQPDPIAGEFSLQSAGRSRYREVELTARYLGGERRDLTVSYVRSHGTADLNNYDQFYGNLRNPKSMSTYSMKMVNRSGPARSANW